MGTVEGNDLEHQPEYEAISWFWGEPPFTGSIILNGLHFAIPRNLEEALKRFRLSDRPRRLWADAVCINQADILEREAQLKLMRDIYSNATCTLVWLGSMGTNIDRITFESLNKLCHGITIRRIILERDFGWTSQEDYSDDELDSYLTETFDSEEVQHEEQDLLTHLSDFFELAWWNRLWVLQEVALAPEVQLF